MITVYCARCNVQEDMRPLKNADKLNSCTPHRLSCLLFLLLSGRRWHLSGLSGLPLNSAFFYYLPASFFCPFIPFQKSLFSQVLFLWAIFFVCTSMLSSSIYRKHSTGQSALHKAAKQGRADQRAAPQAKSRQSWREPPCRRAFKQLSLCSRNERRNRNLPAL